MKDIVIIFLIILIIIIRKLKKNKYIKTHKCTYLEGKLNYSPPNQFLKQSSKIESYLASILGWIKNNNYMNDTEILTHINKFKNDNNFLIVYGLNGKLLLHNGNESNIRCNVFQPICSIDSKNLIGKNLIEYKSINGVDTVKLFIEIAKNGGGWYGYFWNNDKVNIRSKYILIKQVPNRDFLIASGFNS